MQRKVTHRRMSKKGALAVGTGVPLETLGLPEPEMCLDQNNTPKYIRSNCPILLGVRGTVKKSLCLLIYLKYLYPLF